MADDLAVTQHGGAVADALHLFQPVRDVEDRFAFRAQPLQRLEQLVGFLRRQHRGRLVEDDELRRLQQAADDLDALALADRKVADQRIRIERQAVAVGKRPRLGRDRADRRAVVQRQRDVLGRRQRLEQRKVLEHHADAELLRDARAGDPHRLAVPENLAGIGLQRAEQHLDQRRLAGAVLAEQRVDLALGDVEVDMIARRQRAEYLGQATNLKQVRAVTDLHSQCLPSGLPDMFCVPASMVGAAGSQRESGTRLERASRISAETQGISKPGDSRDENGRARRLAAFEVGMRLAGILQRIALVDLDLDRAARAPRRTRPRPRLRGPRAWRCRRTASAG